MGIFLCGLSRAEEPLPKTPLDQRFANSNRLNGFPTELLLTGQDRREFFEKQTHDGLIFHVRGLKNERVYGTSDGPAKTINMILENGFRASSVKNAHTYYEEFRGWGVFAATKIEDAVPHFVRNRFGDDRLITLPIRVLDDERVNIIDFSRAREHPFIKKLFAENENEEARVLEILAKKHGIDVAGKHGEYTGVNVLNEGAVTYASTPSELLAQLLELAEDEKLEPRARLNLIEQRREYIRALFGLQGSIAVSPDGVISFSDPVEARQIEANAFQSIEKAMAEKAKKAWAEKSYSDFYFAIEDFSSLRGRSGRFPKHVRQFYPLVEELGKKLRAEEFETRPFFEALQSLEALVRLGAPLDKVTQDYIIGALDGHLESEPRKRDFGTLGFESAPIGGGMYEFINILTRVLTDEQLLELSRHENPLVRFNVGEIAREKLLWNKRAFHEAMLHQAGNEPFLAEYLLTSKYAMGGAGIAWLALELGLQFDPDPRVRLVAEELNYRESVERSSPNRNPNALIQAVSDLVKTMDQYVGKEWDQAVRLLHIATKSSIISAANAKPLLAERLEKAYGESPKTPRLRIAVQELIDWLTPEGEEPRLLPRRTCREYFAGIVRALGRRRK